MRIATRILVTSLLTLRCAHAHTHTDGVVDLVSIYDHLAFSEYSLGNVKRAAMYTRELLQNGRASLYQRVWESSNYNMLYLEILSAGLFRP